MKSITKSYLISTALALASISPLHATVSELYGGIGNGGNGTNRGALISIDTTTWAGTVVSNPGGTGEVTQAISGLAFDDNGTTLYATLVPSPFQLVTLDAMSGNTLNTVSITNNAQNLQIQDLATDPLTNVLYGVSPGSGGVGGNLYTIDKVTGVATLIGNTGVQRSAIAFDATGKLWQTTDTDELVQIDPLTGMRIGSATTLTQFYNGFTILQSGKFLGVLGDDDNGGIWDITGGTETLLGNSGINTLGDIASLFAAAPPPPGVPEGGNTLVLLGAALVGIGGARYRWLRSHRAHP